MFRNFVNRYCLGFDWLCNVRIVLLGKSVEIILCFYMDVIKVYNCDNFVGKYIRGIDRG